MVYSFDSLGYARRLRERVVAQDQAEAHAEAARDFIMAELVTKTDLLAVRTDLLAVKNDVLAVKQELQSEIRNSVAELRTEMRNNDETLGLRLTVRLGAMLVVAIGALATIMKLAQ